MRTRCSRLPSGCGITTASVCQLSELVCPDDIPFITCTMDLLLICLLWDIFSRVRLFSLSVVHVLQYTHWLTWAATPHYISCTCQTSSFPFGTVSRHWSRRHWLDISLGKGWTCTLCLALANSSSCIMINLRLTCTCVDDAVFKQA